MKRPAAVLPLFALLALDAAAAPPPKAQGVAEQAVSPKTGVDAEDIRDIRGTIEIPDYWRWAALGALGLVAALAVGSTVAAVRRRRRRRVPLTPEARARHALEIARRELGRGDAVAFANTLSIAVREYLDGALAVAAPRRTTEELVATLRAAPNPLLEPHERNVEHMLFECDRARFARRELPRAAGEHMLEDAERMITDITAAVAASRSREEATA